MSTSNNNTVPYTIKTNGAVTLYLNGECLTIATDHPNYSKIIDAIKAGDFSNIDSLVNVSKAVINYAGDKVSIVDGQVFYGSFPLHNTLTSRVLKMMNEGFKFDHMLKFLENLLANSSNRAVNETYTFLENYGLPITDDGCFLAYKAVRGDYKDIYSGKLDNTVGKVVTMPRNMVDEVYERDCSTGLHVGALDYVVQYGHFQKDCPLVEGGNRLLIVKVNPANVVSVPQYESHPKMRVCEYTVVSEIKDVVKELTKVVYTAVGTEFAPDRDTAEPTTTSRHEVDTTSPWNEAKYREGWATAEDDMAEGDDYGTSRDYSEVNSYRLGYNDCFNGRPNQASAATCDDSCDCDCAGWDDGRESESEDTEYNRGYACGYTDAEEMNGFQSSLDIAATDEYKEGYSHGFAEYANN